jgi:hypothetical protein
MENLHSEELHNLCFSPSIIRMIQSRTMRWEGHVVKMAEKNAYRLLVGKPEGRRPVERQRTMWVDNVKIDLGEIIWGAV